MVSFPIMGSGLTPVPVTQHLPLPECHRLFVEIPDVIVNDTGGNPVFYTPLTVCKVADPAL